MRGARCFLQIYERAEYSDLYKWCRGPCFKDTAVGGFDGLRKLLFEVAWTLSVAQAVEPGFKHNDLHAANVLVTLDRTLFKSKPTDLGSEPVNRYYRYVIDMPTTPVQTASECGDGITPRTTRTARTCASEAVPYSDDTARNSTSRTEASSMGRSPFTERSVFDLNASNAGTVQTTSLGGAEVVDAADAARSKPTASSTRLVFNVPVYPCRALLADFDFVWLPGKPNLKVLEFELEDAIWGVSSRHDDSYDLFMLSYHLYITFFEVSYMIRVIVKCGIATMPRSTTIVLTKLTHYTSFRPSNGSK